MSKIFLVILLLVIFAGSVYAKSDNSNPGNAGGNSSNNSSGNSNNNSNQGNASVGQVQEVRENKITIEEKKSNKKVESELDSNTQVIHQNKGRGNINSIKKDDVVAVVSTESGKGNGPKLSKAVKIFVKDATASAQSKRRAIQGVVLNIDGTTLNIAHQIHRDRTNNVFTNLDTEFKIKGVEDGSLSDVEVGNRIVAMGEATEGGILAKRVHVIPGKAVGIFRRLPVSTDSATSSATPSATPVSTDSATPTLEPTPEATSSTESSILTEGTNLLQNLFSAFLNLLGITQ